jgi:CDP-diacylglycerol--glycerol-3-phosphate 3-phosphatidyltransferase
VGLFYGEGPWVKSLSFLGVLIVLWMDALDGRIARKYRQESELGGVLDITGDRIVENVLWICFAHQRLVSVWVPIIVITRGIITDTIRSVALAHGMTAFGEKTMMTSKVGKFLVASRFSRALYGILKTIAFAYVILIAVLMTHQGFDGERFAATTCGWWLWVTKDIIVGLTVALCVLRGVPVIKDGRQLFRLSTASGSGRGQTP